jgi:hypothetical protein
MVVVAKKERQEDISFNHYTVNSRQEILCEPRATYILWDVEGVYYIYTITISTENALIKYIIIYTVNERRQVLPTTINILLPY